MQSSPKLLQQGRVRKDFTSATRRGLASRSEARDWLYRELGSAEPEAAGGTKYTLHSWIFVRENHWDLVQLSQILLLECGSTSVCLISTLRPVFCIYEHALHTTIVMRDPWDDRRPQPR